MANELDLHELLRSLRTVREIRTAWHGLETEIEREIGKVAGQLKQRDGDIDGVPYKVRTSKTEKWDHEGVARQVVAAHLEDAGGEVEPDAIAEAILEACAPSYWRKGILTSHGIAADEYVNVTWGRPTVKFDTGGA